MANTPWRQLLVDRLASDAGFRAEFVRRPGQAAESIGVPFAEFLVLLADETDGALAAVREALLATLAGDEPHWQPGPSDGADD